MKVASKILLSAFVVAFFAAITAVAQPGQGQHPAYLHAISDLRTARALLQLPPATAGAIEKLGADLAVARLRRKESLRSWAQRLGVTVPTLQRLEAGDPSVGVGIVATALWLIKRDGELRNLAAPEHDQGAIEMDVREAVELGRSRAQSSAEARLRAAGNSDKTKD